MTDGMGRAGVVGGGIAGLGAAIALRSAVWEVTLYEQAPEFGEVGAGITLAANALTVLDAMGVGEIVRSAAITNRRGCARNHRGRVLVDARISDFAGGLVALHRADLIAILSAALPRECVRTGTRVLAADPAGRIETDTGTAEYDLVVGADGVNSVVRRTVWREPDPLRRNGMRAWRWVLDEPPPDPVGVIWGSHAEFGIVPIAGDRTYAFAAARPGITTLDYFTDWPDPIPKLIAAADPARIVIDELLETRIARHLGTGRVALIGDAAHVMLPTLGQGAGMAIEDALTLAAHAPDLSAYSAARRRRVATTAFLSRHGMRIPVPNSKALAALRDIAALLTPNPLATRLFRRANSRALRGWRPPTRPASAT
ncbi:FAD-dependent monooxygenase [Nocardia crassostreae]|uniref:FAD-dependent monooxygenase n=1 Tax=Nocardia crassostreae TaxID=53428 RepID=UPI000AD6F8B2|nr:FAD-dependent monooxygenase [Nocardia crassostreae]